MLNMPVVVFAWGFKNMSLTVGAAMILHLVEALPNRRLIVVSHMLPLIVALSIAPKTGGLVRSVQTMHGRAKFLLGYFDAFNLFFMSLRRSKRSHSCHSE